jgi:two-component system, LytTR family, response regulator
MKIRALIVDDEQLARQRVRLLLSEEPDVEVMGESEDGFEAVDQIQAIEAAGKYAVVHVGKENHALRETMSSLESHLPPQRFLRISRSVIVNIDQIQELQPMFKGENLVVLKNGKSYPTTRPVREIQQRLEFR